MTRPASAACTLRRILIAPLRLLTAIRNAWTLKATERGVPVDFPVARNRRPFTRAASNRAGRFMRRPAPTTAPATRAHSAAVPPACSAAKLKMSSRKACAARCVARPATTVPVLPNVDAVHGGAEHSGCDLTMHRVRAIAEFGGAHGELVAAVLVQRRAHIGKVSIRRDGIDHPES